LDVYNDTDVRRALREMNERAFKNEHGHERFLEAARGGDPLSHEILCEVAADLAARGEPLPPALLKYMAVDAPAFKPKRGQPSWGRFRGEAIADAVTLLVAFKGFRPTRNRSHHGNDAHPPSACSLVAAALRQFGINKSEEAVQKAWEKGRRQNWMWVVGEAKWLMFLGWLPPEDLLQKPCPNCGEPHALGVDPHAPGQWFCR
jgi:hypothetical protein